MSNAKNQLESLFTNIADAIRTKDGTAGKIVPADFANKILTLKGNAEDLAQYSGPYEVTPKANETQTLETKDQMMNQNVTIKEIPCYEVSNNMNGKTIIIA